MHASHTALLYLRSTYIVQFVTAHPIRWAPREMTGIGGPGDQAGMTPTPAVAEFLALLARRQDLFTQDEYVAHCRNVWRSWWNDLPLVNQRGVAAKLQTNYYVSMIDSLHVWAMLAETGLFDACILDSYADAVSKSDLTLRRGKQEIRLALIGPTRRALESRYYKLAYRVPPRYKVIEVQMPISRPREPGNKRWYRLHDFVALFSDVFGLYTVSRFPGFR